MLVNGTLIARGEVVVIDEEFGIRISELDPATGRGALAPTAIGPRYMPSHYPAPPNRTSKGCSVGSSPLPTHVARQPSAEPEREPTGMMVEYVTEDDSLAAIVVRGPRRRQLHGRCDRRGRVRDHPRGEQRVETARRRGGKLPRGRGQSGGGLNGEYTPAVRLANVHQLPGELSEEIKQLWRKPGGKRGYRVTVDEYGAGTAILYLS